MPSMAHSVERSCKIYFFIYIYKQKSLNALLQYPVTPLPPHHFSRLFIIVPLSPLYQSIPSFYRTLPYPSPFSPSFSSSLHCGRPIRSSSWAGPVDIPCAAGMCADSRTTWEESQLVIAVHYCSHTYFLNHQLSSQKKFFLLLYQLLSKLFVQ